MSNTNKPNFIAGMFSTLLDEKPITRSAFTTQINVPNTIINKQNTTKPKIRKSRVTKNKKFKRVKKGAGIQYQTNMFNDHKISDNKTSDLSQKLQIEEQRRIPKNSSVSCILSPDEYTRTFFQQEIEEYYPTSITRQHLCRINALLENSATDHYQDVNETIQRAFRMDSEDVLQTIKLVSKQNGQVVSVLVKKPDVSALLFFSGRKLTSSTEAVEEKKSQKDDWNHLDTGMLQLTRSQYFNDENTFELEKRTIFKTHIRAMEKYQTNMSDQASNIDEVQEQLLFLKNLLILKYEQNLKQINNLKHAISQELKDRPAIPSIDDINCQLMDVAIRKNIVKGLEDHQVQVLNYFKLKASEQESKIYIPNKNLDDLADFLARKKIRKNKKTKFPLATSCMGCFSNCSQQSNEIKGCYECGSRSHRICKSIEGSTCSICEGRRSKKIRIKECLLCPNRGFMFRKLGQFNLHVFCLLIFNLYHVEDQQVVVDSDDLLLTQNQQSCSYCRLSNGKLVGCQNSSKYMHPLCAFLGGYSMRIDSRRQIVIDCQCYSETELDKNKFNRLYRGNIHKFAYRFYSYDEYLTKTRRMYSTKHQNIMQEEMAHEEEEQESNLPPKSNFFEDMLDISPNLL